MALILQHVLCLSVLLKIFVIYIDVTNALCDVSHQILECNDYTEDDVYNIVTYENIDGVIFFDCLLNTIDKSMIFYLQYKVTDLSSITFDCQCTLLFERKKLSIDIYGCKGEFYNILKVFIPRENKHINYRLRINIM